MHGVLSAAKRSALSSMCLWKQLATRRAAGAPETQEVMEGRDPTGGADHIRSSLSVVLMDAAPVSTAAVASCQVDHGWEASRGASTPMERTKSRQGGEGRGLLRHE